MSQRLSLRNFIYFKTKQLKIKITTPVTLCIPKGSYGKMTKDEYNKCVEEYADGVFRFLSKNLKDADTARSVVQSAFEKMWVRHHDIEAEKAKSYLFTTAYHLMIDEIKYSQRFVNMEEAVMNHTSEHKSYQNKEVKLMVNKAAAQLPEEQRSVLMLRDYEGYSYDEIARITGLNLSQVKVYLFRARVFIKNYIGKMEAVI